MNLWDRLKSLFGRGVDDVATNGPVEGTINVSVDVTIPLHAQTVKRLNEEKEWLDSRLRFLRGEAQNLGLLRRGSDQL